MGDVVETHLNVDPTEELCEEWLERHNDHWEETKSEMEGYTFVVSDECFMIIVTADDAIEV